jgi:hypothetical protein
MPSTAQREFHQDEVCLKITPTQAVDDSCARGWCFDVRPDTECDLAVRNVASLRSISAAPSVCLMKLALDQRYRTGGRAARDRTMILDIDSLGDFPLDAEAGGPLDAPDEIPAGSCNSVDVRRGPWHLNGGRGVFVASVTVCRRDDTQAGARA